MRVPKDVMHEAYSRKHSRRSRAHECPRCAEWLEVLVGVTDGRGLEAGIEASRLMHADAQWETCPVARRTVNFLRVEGILETPCEHDFAIFENNCARCGAPKPEEKTNV